MSGTLDSYFVDVASGPVRKRQFRTGPPHSAKESPPLTAENWGLPQDWGSGGDRDWRGWIVGGLEFLSEAGTERSIVDGATNLEQQIGAASRPPHLL